MGEELKAEADRLGKSSFAFAFYMDRLNLLGVKQLLVGVNKMDTDTAGPYSKARYDEVGGEMKNMLIKVGWKKDFVEKSTPVLPISGWMGDNLIKKTENMTWWSGMDILVEKTKLHIDTLYDCLNDMCSPPGRNETAPMRMPISGIYKIKGVGDVLAGRIEQGIVDPNTEVMFMPTHTTANACGGKVFTIEMHHTRHEQAKPGDNVGLNIKGLDKINMPRVGDVMIYKKDSTLDRCGQFTAQIQTLDIPGEIKLGYSPIGFVRCGRSACRATGFDFKVGKETGGIRWRTPTRSSRTRWRRSSSCPSSRSSSTPSRTARASPASRSSTATPLSCLARSPAWCTRRTCRLRRPARRARSKVPMCVCLRRKGESDVAHI